MPGRIGLGTAVIAMAIGPLAQAQEHTAKIVLGDGTPIRTNPLIIPSRAETCEITSFSRDGTVTYSADFCLVMIRLKGYRKAEVVLHDGAVIVLKRLGEPEGSIVSAATIGAPKDARKAYENGVAAMIANKWLVAQERFETAVRLYPKYAPAWNDLGDVFHQEAKPQEARTAYQRTIEADPRYIKPYVELAKLDLAAGRNEDAVAISDRALEQNPVEYPAIYFYSALANFNLARLEIAEKNVRRAIDLDTHREIPRAEHLLGRILLARGDRRGAIEHLKKYIELSPKAPDAADVKQTIGALYTWKPGAKYVPDPHYAPPTAVK